MPKIQRWLRPAFVCLSSTNKPTAIHLVQLGLDDRISVVIPDLCVFWSSHCEQTTKIGIAFAKSLASKRAKSPTTLCSFARSQLAE
jgi:hypothetical protein